ncbi:Bifunctional ligase/repressor BirA [Planctomycetes bacterium MalM25]|nr:Bifunctional ligase/repressor BirA [Planctomycetes bacterium MalM25]
MSGPFDAEHLRGASLAERVEVHKRLGSTNDRAKELAKRDDFAPTLVVAEEQTAGRGRGTNQWHAADGALTFSLLLAPESLGLVAQQQGLISIATAVAVIDAARATARLEAGFKWPNDVWLNGKKLAGILLEAPRPDRLVIGVGVNANNRFDDAPEEVAAKATSLREAAGSEIDRQALLLAFLESLGRRITQLASADAGPIEAARAACLLTGKQVTLADGDRTLFGRCQGLNKVGALLIQHEHGVAPFHAGSITGFSD